jgi:hypothetical protein
MNTSGIGRDSLFAGRLSVNGLQSVLLGPFAEAAKHLSILIGNDAVAVAVGAWLELQRRAIMLIRAACHRSDSYGVFHRWMAKLQRNDILRGGVHRCQP